MKLYMESVHDIRSQKPLSVIGNFSDRDGSSKEKNVFSSKELLLYTVGKFIENRANNNKRVGSKNWLVTSDSRSKILKKLGITTLIPVCSWKCSCCKQSNYIHLKLLTFYIKRVWNKTNLRNSRDSEALFKNLKCEFFHSAKKRSEL